MMSGEISSHTMEKDYDDPYEYTTGNGSLLPFISANEERVKVDRRTLESMIQDPSCGNEAESAAEFFQRVMDETDTQISWPSKLKVGAKSKKDPHIKIFGEPDDIQAAKMKILEVFDTKKSKVTLKVDVSYTDHSHVIGKGGNTIQQVMDETGCHIHFPDSNRNPTAEKSNQVSIAGPATGVEKARCKIRGLLPLVLTFEVPHNIPDFSTSSTVQMIFQSFGFTATYRPIIAGAGGGGALVMVRGSCRQLLSIRQGVMLLMNYLVGGGTILPPVTLRTEISPQHHAFVLGPLGCNVRLIMRATGAMIAFPDLMGPPSCIPYPQQLFPNFPMQTKSTVSITGKFDAVYTAWQLLMGYLPLVMMFDLREGQDIHQVLLAQMMDQYKVSISIRPKRKENVKTVTVRGPEHSSKALFEVRRHLLDLDESEVPTCCERHSGGNPLAAYISQMSAVPSATFVPTSPDPLKYSTASMSFNQSHYHQQHPLMSHNIPHGQHPSSGVHSNLGGWPSQPVPPGSLYTPSPSNSQTLLSHLLNQVALDIPSGNGAPQHQQSYSVTSQYNNFSSTSSTSHVSNTTNKYIPPWEHESSSSSGFSTPNLSPRHSPLHFQRDLTTSNSAFGASHSNQERSSLWHNQASSTHSTESANSDFASNSKHSSEASSLRSTTASSSFKDSASLGYGSMTDLNDFPLDQTKNFSSECSHSGLGLDPNLDYEDKKLLATKAIQKPIGSEIRTPTNAWAGCGFSKSMPEIIRDNPSLLKLIQAYNPSSNQSSTVNLATTSSSQDIKNLSSNMWSSNLSMSNSSCTDHGWMISSNPSSPPFLRQNHDSAFSKGVASSGFGSSNKFEGLLSFKLTPEMGPDPDMPQILARAGLAKYIDTFVQYEIDVPAFLSMSDTDFQEFNIPFGARRKMMLVQHELCTTKTFQAAPGAERRALRPVEDFEQTLERAKRCW